MKGMKSKSFKKLLAFILTLTMVFGSLGLAGINADSAYAGEEYTTIDDTQTVLNKVLSYYKTEQKGILADWWELLAVYTAGENLADYVLPETKIITDNSMPSDYIGVFITELIKGNSLSKIQAQKLVSKQDLSTGSFGYEMSNQQAWAMIALDLYNRNANEADKVSYDVKKAIEYLLTFQTDGNFYYSSQYPYPGVDYTGAVAIALAPYLNTEQWPDTLDSKNLTNNALKYDKTEYGSYGNAGTAAFAIYGYNALGVNFDNLDYTNAVNELITYQVGDGGFYNPYGEDNSSNSYYTKQAAVALAETLKGKSSFINLTKNTIKYISVDVSAQVDGAIIKKAITIPSTTTVGAVVAQVVPSDTDLTDYIYYIDGAVKGLNDTLSYGDSIIALPSNITYISSICADKTEINIGESMTLTLSAINLSTGESADSVSGASIVVNGRTEDAIKLDDTGEYTFSPTEAGEYNFSVIWPDGVDSYSTAIYTVRVKCMDQAIPVSVRVEGIDSNILYNKSLTVAGSESLLTVYDAITQALSKGGVPFEATTEGLFKSINGIANDTTYQTSVYWMYTINEEQYLNGSKWVSPTTLIKDNDEIIVYCGSSATYPFVQSELMENGNVKITFSSYQYDSNWNLSLKEISEANVVWALGTDNEYRSKTDANGIVTIPAEKAAAGTYTLQIEKLDANGVPEVIRLAPGFEVTVEDGGTSSTVPSTPSESVPKVSISVIGPDKNILLPKTDYTYSSRMTALSLLRSTGLSLTYNDSSKTYVSGIEGYTEFDYGPTSGWLFKVNNDESILSSAAEYKLKAKDHVTWFYTKDYTKEAGSSKWNENSPKPDYNMDENDEKCPFTDVTSDQWYYNPVKYVYENGLFSGTSLTTFEPNKPFTRAMLVSVLARLSKADLSKYSIGSFEDVAIDTWYGPSVAWAKEAGVVSGYITADGKATFRPDEKISRQDMAVMINNYAEKIAKKSIEGTNEIKVFTDKAQIASYADTAVSVMQQAGIINGVKNPDKSYSFLPCNNATRAEAAQMIAVYLQKY
jgi:hypothetical protein